MSDDKQKIIQQNIINNDIGSDCSMGNLQHKEDRMGLLVAIMLVIFIIVASYFGVKYGS